MTAAATHHRSLPLLSSLSPRQRSYLRRHGVSPLLVGGKMMCLATLVLLAISTTITEAFSIPSVGTTTTAASVATTTIWSKRMNRLLLDDHDPKMIQPVQQELQQQHPPVAATTASISITNKENFWFSSSLPVLTAAALLLLQLLPVPAAYAVSGGGLDYANLDISGQDFSNQSYKGKDFTQVLAKATIFRNADLSGCRFYKA
jgi:hypothetical protein